MDLYKEAANIVKNVLSKKDSLKSSVFSSKIKSKKALYALCCESLRCWVVLQEILDRCGLLKQEKALASNLHLATVLLYEHLLGKGIRGKYRTCFKRHRFAIHTQAELMKIRAGVSDLKQLIDTPGKGQAMSLPKYARVNTLLTSMDDTCRQLTHNQGYEQLTCDSQRFKEVVSSLAGRQFTKDPDISGLLVFPPNTDFHQWQLYKEGRIIVQDKASCFPAHILSPSARASVIDCCAAPGNKTSHLAAIMANKGTVYAFDKNERRLKTLKQQMSRAGASSVVPECCDFLQVNPSDPRFADVEYILVDPSCSGSGMVNRLLQHTDESDSSSPERLAQLARFQTDILSHALCFPHVRRVVYSTCSVHEQENEQVVEHVLTEFQDSFRLNLIMPDWPHRGLENTSVGKYCIRMSHEEALTNGFFVACFERIHTLGKSNNIFSNTSNKSKTHSTGELVQVSPELKKIDNKESAGDGCVENKSLGKRKKGASVELQCVSAKVRNTADTDSYCVKRKKRANACKKKKKKNKKHKQ